MKTIDPTKQYISPEGYPVRIYATDGGPSKQEIHAAYYTQRGGWNAMYFNSAEEFFDIGYKEHNPLNDLKIDAPVIVWDNTSGKLNRHFAGIHTDGKILTFAEGTTSFSSTKPPVIWPYWELPWTQKKDLTF